MLDITFGLKDDAERVTNAVHEVLKQGFRTADIATKTTEKQKILGTKEMGKRIIDILRETTL